ncbi:MAG: hypothetical protein ACJASK_000513, partial [Ilumatobacter sp.]
MFSPKWFGWYRLLGVSPVTLRNSNSTFPSCQLLPLRTEIFSSMFDRKRSWSALVSSIHTAEHVAARLIADALDAIGLQCGSRP